MLAIGSFATKSYLFAWPQCVRRIAAAANYKNDVHFIFSTDKSKEAKEAEEIARSELPEGWKFTVLNLDVDDSDKEKYKQNSQFVIAALQGAAFSFARKIRADQFWSVESDTLVPPDALKMSEWVLQMPRADGAPYYDIAACTYPNGLFLGGFGSYHQHINEDFLPEERNTSERFKNIYNKCNKKIEEYEKQLKDLLLNKKDDQSDKNEFVIKIQNLLQKEVKRFNRLRDKIKNYPPDGNIWEVISKHGWRKRGWMDFAYPGIGKGSIVPSDWCGLGCTLLSKKALALAEYSGYEGLGTQDLFLCWNRWHPANLKIACIPHVACDHVKHKNISEIESKEKVNPYVHYISYHEHDPDFEGHLRVKQQDWIPL
jgi:hypothetical protein